MSRAALKTQQSLDTLNIECEQVRKKRRLLIKILLKKGVNGDKRTPQEF